MAHSHHTSALLMLGGVALIAVIALGLWGNVGTTGAAFARNFDARCVKWQSACDAGKTRACNYFAKRCLDVSTHQEVNALARKMDLLKEELGRQALVDKKVLMELDDIRALISRYHPLIDLPYNRAYTAVPLMECVECTNNEIYDGKPCCADNFEQNCLARDGLIRWSDLMPVYPGRLFGCFQKAPDAGKACASGSDCLSEVCDLASATSSCRLIKKTAGSDARFFTAKYACSTQQPGTCAEAIENKTNPGGISHYFRMDGMTLIEIQEPGPIF